MATYPFYGHSAAPAPPGTFFQYAYQPQPVFYQAHASPPVTLYYVPFSHKAQACRFAPPACEPQPVFCAPPPHEPQPASCMPRSCGPISSCWPSYADGTTCSGTRRYAGEAQRAEQAEHAEAPPYFDDGSHYFLPHYISGPHAQLYYSHGHKRAEGSECADTPRFTQASWNDAQPPAGSQEQRDAGTGGSASATAGSGENRFSSATFAAGVCMDKIYSSLSKRKDLGPYQKGGLFVLCTATIVFALGPALYLDYWMAGGAKPDSTPYSFARSYCVCFAVVVVLYLFLWTWGRIAHERWRKKEAPQEADAGNQLRPPRTEPDGRGSSSGVHGGDDVSYYPPGAGSNGRQQPAGGSNDAQQTAPNDANTQAAKWWTNWRSWWKCFVYANFYAVYESGWLAAHRCI